MADGKDLNKGLIKYTSRDYNSLVNEFFELVPKLTSLWKPESSSDPGVVLGHYLASVADVLNVNIDWLANEVFAPSVKQRKDAEKILGLIGYTLGFYTAPRTEVTFTNNSEDSTIDLDFGFNGSNFATLNAYTDITNNTRTITYNILPMSNSYGADSTRSKREITTSSIDVFTNSDKVSLKPGESVTKVAIEGTIRSYQIPVSKVKDNNYVINIPSQHVDSTAIWLMAKATASSDDYLNTQWIQCENTSGFVTPEPRFCVTYDNYSNAQITVSSYLNELDNYDSNYFIVYWIDTSGAIGCVSNNVLTNFLPAVGDQVSSNSGELLITNLSNIVELPNTYTVTGRSPETAKEAYRNSRNYINTFDSLVTLPDYHRFLNREAGVDCGTVVDCQKAMEINLAIYNDKDLTDSQKQKMYITNQDFPQGDSVFDWEEVLNLGFDPNNPSKFLFSTNFKTYTAMCFAIHNDFKDSEFGMGRISPVKTKNRTNFIQYKPPQLFIDNVVNDYRPLQAMSVEMQFGYARIFKFAVVGSIYTVSPVSESVADVIINNVQEALKMHFAPANREFGVKPNIIEIVDVIENCDKRIKYFDAGSNNNDCILWMECDPEYFNYISFAQYTSMGTKTVRVSPSCIIEQ